MILVAFCCSDALLVHEALLLVASTARNAAPHTTVACTPLHSLPQQAQLAGSCQQLLPLRHVGALLVAAGQRQRWVGWGALGKEGTPAGGSWGQPSIGLELKNQQA